MKSVSDRQPNSVMFQLLAWIMKWSGRQDLKPWIVLRSAFMSAETAQLRYSKHPTTQRSTPNSMKYSMGMPAIGAGKRNTASLTCTYTHGLGLAGKSPLSAGGEQ